VCALGWSTARMGEWLDGKHQSFVDTVVQVR
jgi:hypothetical protein